jgi:hypothetical protein
MQEQTSVRDSLASSIVHRVEELIDEARKATKPLEIDPFRSRLFELFVTAEAAGFLVEAAEHDLTADGLCRRLAEHWQLADATRDSIEHQTKLPPDQLTKMRMLWSVMRMWMEWTYAWQRWPEFRGEGA